MIQHVCMILKSFHVRMLFVRSYLFYLGSLFVTRRTWYVFTFPKRPIKYMKVKQLMRCKQLQDAINLGKKVRIWWMAMEDLACNFLRIPTTYWIVFTSLWCPCLCLESHNLYSSLRFLGDSIHIGQLIVLGISSPIALFHKKPISIHVPIHSCLPICKSWKKFRDPNGFGGLEITWW